MGGAVPSRLSKTNWGTTSGGLVVGGGDRSGEKEDNDDKEEEEVVYGIDGNVPTSEYSIYELKRRSAIFHPRDFIVTDTFHKTLYKTRGISKTVWGLELLDVNSTSVSAPGHNPAATTSTTQLALEDVMSSIDDLGKKHKQDDADASLKKEEGSTKSEKATAKEAEEDSKETTEEEKPQQEELWAETNAKVLLRVLPNNNHRFSIDSASRRKHHHHTHKKKLTTTYYDIYRSGIPTFDGQKPATLPELANPIQEPVFKVACVMVHNDSKTAIAAKYGPPALTESLDLNDDDEDDSSSPNDRNESDNNMKRRQSSGSCADIQEEEDPGMNDDLDDDDEDFGSESHDIFEHAAEIAARRKRINSGEGEVLVELPSGGGDEEGDTKSTDSAFESAEIRAKAVELLGSSSSQQRNNNNNNNSNRSRSASTDESSGIFSTGSSSMFSGTTATSTGTGWSASVRHLWDGGKNGRSNRKMTKEERRRAKYELALEGVIDWDELCFQAQETLEGDHQTSMISKDAVHELLKEERKKQRRRNDVSSNNGDEPIGSQKDNNTDWMKKSVEGVQNLTSNLHLEDVKQKSVESVRKSLVNVQSLTSTLFASASTAKTSNPTTGGASDDAMEELTGVKKEEGGGSGGGNNWMKLGRQSLSKFGWPKKDNNDDSVTTKEEEGETDTKDTEEQDGTTPNTDEDVTKKENGEGTKNEEEKEKEDGKAIAANGEEIRSPGNDETKKEAENITTTLKEVEEVEEPEVVDERPLVAYWSWQKGHKMTMHLAKESDLALHVVMAIIISRGISIGT